MATTSQIKIKTETEQMLYKAYSEEKADNDNLRQIIQNMQAQINELQDLVDSLKQEKEAAVNVTAATPIESSSNKIEYTTDEEELAKETEWVRVKNKRNKKRKLNTSPIPIAEENINSKTIKEKRNPPPPPIIVDGVDNYQNFFDSLTQNQPKNSFMTKIMKEKSVKINALNEETYKCLTKKLTENHYLWHSYENKQERPLRVMVKNLHSSCIPQRIIEDLQKQNFKIEEAVNKLSWKTKEPLNMFVLTFRNDEDTSKVYGIKSILGCKVEVHPIKTSRLVPQCKRCQAYGHTQKYCSKEPRCVKCTGKHLTRDCQKTSIEKPKCVHCGEPHPANYRGCIVAKEMQNIKNNNKKKTKITSNAKVQQAVKNPGNKVDMKHTYAAVAQASKSKDDRTSARIITPSRDSLEGKLDEIIKMMSSFDGRLKKLENGTKDSIPRKTLK